MSLVSGSWATAADVLAVTGVTVDDAAVTRAQGIIDIYSNVTTGVTASGNISVRDQRLLGQAVCYQAVWQANQVDVYTRTDVSSVNQDGMQFTPGNPEALMLAPLAKRCLDRISWRRPRSLRVRPGRDTTFTTNEELANAWVRDEGPTDYGWLPS